MKLNQEEYKIGERNAGYDFCIIGDKKKKIGKYIEVKSKGNKSKCSWLMISKNEMNKAKNNKKDYFVFFQKGGKWYKLPYSYLEKRINAIRLNLLYSELSDYEYE